MALHNRLKDHLTKFCISWLVAVLWVSIVIVSMTWNLHHIKSDFIELARQNAETILKRDLLYRQWAAFHGGIYVPVTERTPPNPYLTHIPDRDINGPEGKQLTLVNPAYMTRGVNEIADRKGELSRGHITSLTPLRPENAPDPWEKAALKAFGSGQQEVGGIQLMDSRPFFRLIMSLRTEATCLKCHASQGYEIGDIRGGISISIPFGPYQEAISHQRFGIIFSHCVVGGLVLAALMAGMFKIEGSKQALKDLLKRYELIMEGAVGGIWDWHVPKKKVYFSPVWAAMRGYRKDEISDSEAEWSAGIHPDDKDRVMTAVQDHFEGKSNVFDETYRVRRKDDSWLWIRDRGKALKNDTGRVVRMAGSEVDVTERIHAEEKVRQNEKKFRTLVEVSPSGIWLTDAIGNNTYVSSQWVKITGIPKKNALGRGWSEGVHHEDRELIRSGWYSHVSSRQPYRSEFRFARPEGDTVWVLCIARPQTDDEGMVIGWVGTITDITVQKGYEAEQARLIRELQKAVDDIDTLNQMLPICASCKKIRDDKGYWDQIETYISRHSRAEFSHSICPDCAAKQYPDLDIYPDPGQKK